MMSGVCFQIHWRKKNRLERKEERGDKANMAES